MNSDGRSLSAYKIRKHCEGSLKRLQTDWIDLYQMHHIDRDCPWNETWQAFGSLIDQGKVVYVGSSNFAGWDIATANQEAAKRGMVGLVSEQSIYHLNNRTVELEVIPACRHYGLGLIPWSPLAGGLLGGALEKLETCRRKGADFEKEVTENRDKLEKYEALCREIGHPPSVRWNAGPVATGMHVSRQLSRVLPVQPGRDDVGGTATLWSIPSAQ